MNKRRPQKSQNFFDYMTNDIADHQAVVGPIVLQPPDFKQWYFCVSTCGPDGWRSDSIAADDKALCEEARADLLFSFVQGRPFITHDCDDELYAAMLCESLWPGERITSVRKAIEAERKATA